MIVGTHFVSMHMVLEDKDHGIIRGVHYSAIGILFSDGINDVYIKEILMVTHFYILSTHQMLLPILYPFNGQNKHPVVEVKQYLQANSILYDTSLSSSSIGINSITAYNCKAYIKNAGYTYYKPSTKNNKNCG